MEIEDLKSVFKNKWVLIGLAVAFLALLLVVSGWYQKYQVQEALKAIDVPSEWQFVERSESGNLQCLDLCYSVTNKYHASINQNDAPNLLSGVLMNSKFTLTESDEKCLVPENISGDVVFCSFKGINDDLTLIVTFTPIGTNYQPDGNKQLQGTVTVTTRQNP